MKSTQDYFVLKRSDALVLYRDLQNLFFGTKGSEQEYCSYEQYRLLKEYVETVFKEDETNTEDNVTQFYRDLSCELPKFKILGRKGKHCFFYSYENTLSLMSIKSGVTVNYNCRDVKYSLDWDIIKFYYDDDDTLNNSITIQNYKNENFFEQFKKFYDSNENFRKFCIKLENDKKS